MGMMVNNADWLDQLGSSGGLLRDVRTHFTVNRMLTFDSVKLRLDREQPMTFLEFRSMIFAELRFPRAPLAPYAGMAWCCRSAAPINGAISFLEWN